jgi:hypothetical protein
LLVLGTGLARGEGSSPLIFVFGLVFPQINYFFPKGDMYWIMVFAIVVIGVILVRIGKKIKEE